MPVIQRANRGDAEQLSKLAEETFRETFGAVNTAGNINLHCQASYSEAIQAGEISDPDRVTLLSREAATLVGFAQLRWGAAPGCVRAGLPGEIQRLYVVKDWHGRGVAHDLMHACLREMIGRGSDVVWLGVWERNPKAISFYKKFGFVEVGHHIFTVGNDPQRDIVMVRPVAGS